MYVVRVYYTGCLPVITIPVLHFHQPVLHFQQADRQTKGDDSMVSVKAMWQQTDKDTKRDLYCQYLTVQKI